MKIVIVLFSVFVLSCSLFAQPVFKKQISFLDFDARNPSFMGIGSYGWFGSVSVNALLFEGYKDNVHPQIFTLKYDLEKDSFYAPTQITFSKGSCINPCGAFIPTLNIAELDKVIWQTDENGNWDIAYGELLGDTLRNVHILAKDLIDEINPRLVVPYYSSNFVFGVTYEKAGSIFLYVEVDTLKVTEKIFEVDDSYAFENASGALWAEYPSKNYYGTIAAEKKFQNGKRGIVYKNKNYNMTNWGDEKYLYDSLTDVTRPKIEEGWGDIFVTFETIIEGRRELKYFWNAGDFGHPDLAGNISDSSYETFNFSMKPILFVTKSLYDIGQSIYQIKKEEKNYLLPSFFNSYNNYLPKDSLIEVKISEPKVTTGIVAWKDQQLWAYSVWEDSSDNSTIQLFSSSGVYDIVGIEDETSPQDFKLYQNYPNPFNPETVISFQLSVRSNVSLKIFDVLGREVATLVNEEKPAGEYQVLFNNRLTTNHQLLSSGVLFYQLKVGNRLQTKSMLLLK